MPEFPVSNARLGALRPFKPTPFTVTVLVFASSVIGTPRAWKIFAVFTQSSANKKREKTDSFSANEPMIMARCEMDLSPGISERIVWGFRVCVAKI